MTGLSLAAGFGEVAVVVSDLFSQGPAQDFTFFQKLENGWAVLCTIAFLTL